MRDYEDKLYGVLYSDEEFRDRIDRIKKIRLAEIGNEEMVLFDIERHPSLEGLQTKGVPSAGYWVVLQTWRVNLIKKTKELEEDIATDLKVENFDGLVDEDVFNTVDSSEDPPDGMTDPDDIKVFAVALANDFISSMRETKYPYERMANGVEAKWEQYLDAFFQFWRDSFIERYVESQLDRLDEEND